MQAWSSEEGMRTSRRGSVKKGIKKEVSSATDLKETLSETMES